VAVPEREVVRHEESFDAGWDNWVGGVADWKVDVAGVRIGSLALYLPTLEMSDYDLEFLGRIDTRTLNWVVRAGGGDTHLRCTLTVVEGGQIDHMAERWSAGTAEDVIARIPASREASSWVPTRLSVRQAIDSGHTPATGGIGFMGAPEDRARIYWVRSALRQPRSRSTYTSTIAMRTPAKVQALRAVEIDANDKGGATQSHLARPTPHRGNGRKRFGNCSAIAANEASAEIYRAMGHIHFELGAFDEAAKVIARW
jgi:hypothetical protein